MQGGIKLIWLLSLLLFYCISSAQDTLFLEQQSRWDSIYKMEAYGRYYIDASNKQEPRRVIRQQFLQDSNFYKTILNKFGSRPVTGWIRWIIHNTSAAPEGVTLFFNQKSFFTAYCEDDSGFRLFKNNYSFFSFRPKDERRSFTFVVRPGATIKVYVRMRNAYSNFVRGYPTIMRPSEYELAMSNILYRQRYLVFADVLFLSIIFFITLHTLAQYFFNRRKEFLLYAFYAACAFIFFLYKFDEFYFINLFFPYLPYIHKYGNNPLSYLMFFAYYRFVRAFIDFKRIASWFYDIIIITERILLAAIITDIILNQLNFFGVKEMIFNVLRSYLIIMAFTGIILLFRTGKPLPRFIAVGSGCFVLGAMIAMVLSWIWKQPASNRFEPINYMQLGMVIELLCFTLGLSYKTSLIEKEKIATQQQLIEQLEENKKLQDELNTRLESRVKEQTSHILEQHRQLEQEKEQQLTLDFTKKITEMELQLLKSQLNPHFYFNTLHNLYGLAMIAPKKAPDAILKLSDIMEYVIYDCRKDKVPVTKELRFINSYIELEKLRYDDSAKISLQVLGDAEGKLISPLLLIQFIENAFKHGLEQYKTNSYLRINIDIQNGQLQYESVNSINDSYAVTGGGLGLANVKKRLEIIYPAKHQLNIHADRNEYKVQLILKLC